MTVDGGSELTEFSRQITPCEIVDRSNLLTVIISSSTQRNAALAY